MVWTRAQNNTDADLHLPVSGQHHDAQGLVLSDAAERASAFSVTLDERRAQAQLQQALKVQPLLYISLL